MTHYIINARGFPVGTDMIAVFPDLLRAVKRPLRASFETFPLASAHFLYEQEEDARAAVVFLSLERNLDCVCMVHSQEKPRVDIISDALQKLTVAELDSVSPAVRAQLVALTDALSRKQIDDAMNALINSGRGQLVPFIEFDNDHY